LIADSKGFGLRPGPRGSPPREETSGSNLDETVRTEKADLDKHTGVQWKKTGTLVDTIDLVQRRYEGLGRCEEGDDSRGEGSVLKGRLKRERGPSCSYTEKVFTAADHVVAAWELAKRTKHRGRLR